MQNVARHFCQPSLIEILIFKYKFRHKSDEFCQDEHFSDCLNPIKTNKFRYKLDEFCKDESFFRLLKSD